MDEMVQAALLFWIPALALVVGTGTALSSRSQSIKLLSKIIALTGFVFVLLSPMTVPESPSSAAGHLLGSIIGPCNDVVAPDNFIKALISLKCSFNFFNFWLRFVIV